MVMGVMSKAKKKSVLLGFTNGQSRRSSARSWCFLSVLVLFCSVMRMAFAVEVWFGGCVVLWRCLVVEAMHVGRGLCVV